MIWPSRSQQNRIKTLRPNEWKENYKVKFAFPERVPAARILDYIDAAIQILNTIIFCIKGPVTLMEA